MLLARFVFTVLPRTGADLPRARFYLQFYLRRGLYLQFPQLRVLFHFTETPHEMSFASFSRER
jgi:hypothetical protein